MPELTGWDLKSCRMKILPVLAGFFILLEVVFWEATVS